MSQSIRKPRDSAVWLTLIQAFRIVGVLFLYELQRGNLPAVFALPAGIGDILVGLTAPMVAVLLRRGDVPRWSLAITWNALGLADLVYAVPLGVLSGSQYLLTSYLAVVPAFFVPSAIVLHLATITILTRRIRQFFRKLP